MVVWRHIKDRQETNDACNADKSFSQLPVNAPVRRLRCMYGFGCEHLQFKATVVSLINSCLIKATCIGPIEMGKKMNRYTETGQLW